MKKFLALVLAMVMVLVLSLFACSNNAGSTNNNPPADNNSGSDGSQSAALDPVTLRIWFHGSNVAPESSAKVMEEVKAYLADKINVTLEPIWGIWGDFDTATVTTLAGGDVDIYFTCNWSANEYNKYARDGYWVKLDDLLPTYGADLLTTIPDGIWECTKTNGYDGVPALKDTATQNCWDVNGTLLAELGYDVDAVCSAGLDYYSDEFEEMLKAAKEYKGGDFYPLVGEPVVWERTALTSSTPPSCPMKPLPSPTCTPSTASS